MQFSEQELQQITQGNRLNSDWPFPGATDEDIDLYFRQIIETLNQSGRLEVQGEFESYGSGFASYVHLFCQRPHGKSETRDGELVVVSGLAIYLNRLVPVAVYGPEKQTRFKRGSSRGFLEVEDIGKLPDPSWVEEEQVIVRTLQSAGMELLDRQTLSEPLKYDIQIDTNFDDNNLFDALFYWWD